MSDFIVVMQDYCEWCNKASAEIRKAGYDYEIMNLDGMPLVKALMKAADYNTVPLILHRQSLTIIGGYEDLLRFLYSNDNEV